MNFLLPSDKLLNSDTYVQGAKKLGAKMVDKIPDMIVGSLTLVAALTWNDVIKELINYYTPEKYQYNKQSNPWIKFAYAAILSIIIVIIITLLIASQDHVESIIGAAALTPK